MPTGRPPSVKPQGTEAAGCDVIEIRVQLRIHSM
jgi:hypothetical protein